MRHRCVGPRLGPHVMAAGVPGERNSRAVARRNGLRHMVAMPRSPRKPTHSEICAAFKTWAALQGGAIRSPSRWHRRRHVHPGCAVSHGGTGSAAVALAGDLLSATADRLKWRTSADFDDGRRRSVTRISGPRNHRYRMFVRGLDLAPGNPGGEVHYFCQAAVDFDVRPLAARL